MHPRQLDSAAVLERAVAGADEAELAEQLGVEVAGEDDALGALAGDGRDDVDHLDRAERRGAVERLLGGLDAERGQLRLMM